MKCLTKSLGNGWCSVNVSFPVSPSTSLSFANIQRCAFVTDIKGKSALDEKWLLTLLCLLWKGLIAWLCLVEDSSGSTLFSLLRCVLQLETSWRGWRNLVKMAEPTCIKENNIQIMLCGDPCWILASNSCLPSLRIERERWGLPLCGEAI